MPRRGQTQYSVYPCGNKILLLLQLLLLLLHNNDKQKTSNVGVVKLKRTRAEERSIDTNKSPAKIDTRVVCFFKYL